MTDVEKNLNDYPSSGSMETQTVPVPEGGKYDIDDADHDAVFGVRKEGAVNYRSMGWIQATIVMLKTIIALGVLAMPTVLSATGGVPGSLIILIIGLITTWTGHVVGLFKKNHPEVYSMDGVGYILGGKWGREFFTVAYPMFMIFLSGSGFVAISIAFNAVTAYATCTVAWVVVAMVGTFALASIQTLSKVSILGWIGFVSVMAAILIITISVGIQDRPSAAPQTGPWDKNIAAVNHEGTFLGGMGAVSTVVFSYSGTPAFFNVVGEMRKPRDYDRSLYWCQSIVTATYLTIGIVVYYYCGQYLANPALGSAGTIIKKVAYAIALPGLFVSVTIYTHVGAKMIFVRVLRGSEHLTAHTFTHWAVWLGTVAGCVTISFILAEAIPFFGDLVNLIGATLGTLMCMIACGWMWLHDNLPRRRSDKSLYYRILVVLNVAIVIAGFFIVITGTWSAVVSIRNSYSTGLITSPFSCADNSNSS
ncbi:uncharacterized protein I303_104940 [Kwoniella dejecticola CBS 10117]|uniref:Neutral amino acid transporter n=1 Tax=Kwoniella dejecticola CBS 10117 TaxID=1296121 RepID=A0A1A6A3X2_9TREE|nr:neutral amino acid transporter [Kwoniella dejecticola CBS 10117]OBR84755.1 neutral amino acid transporter [Kwoniella dejecticola CBS 10117]